MRRRELRQHEKQKKRRSGRRASPFIQSMGRADTDCWLYQQEAAIARKTVSAAAATQLPPLPPPPPLLLLPLPPPHWRAAAMAVLKRR
jgi:hypothetical protein